MADASEEFRRVFTGALEEESDPMARKHLEISLKMPILHIAAKGWSVRIRDFLPISSKPVRGQ